MISIIIFDKWLFDIFMQQNKADSQQFHIWKVVSFTPRMEKYLDQVRSGPSHPGE